MCGIAGQISSNTELLRDQTAVFRQMQQSMSRRGPDQHGMVIEDGAALIHARLCVIDPENGLQPMQLRLGDKEWTLVYNGELYNTAELRAQLEQQGHLFRGHSDTEVLLHAFVQWGPDCVSRFNGIFAFAVWEKQTRRLFAARDRMGVKPFFYAQRGESFLFASELKTLLCHPLVQPEIDSAGFAEVMLIGPGRTPGCGVFRDVWELQPGECGSYNPEQNRFETHFYWRPEDHPHTDSFEQTVETVRALVLDSIERQRLRMCRCAPFFLAGWIPA